MSPEKSKKNPTREHISTVNIKRGTIVDRVDIIRVEDDSTDPEPDPSAERIEVVEESLGDLLLTYTVKNPDEAAPQVTADSNKPEEITREILSETAQIAVEGVGGDFFNASFDQSKSNIPLQQIVDAGLTPPQID